MSLSINCQFDAGAIEVVSVKRADQIQLKIRRDRHAEFAQWFYFCLTGAKNQACQMTLLNASESAYPDGWKDYHAVASYNLTDWFRVPTKYDGKVLTIMHQPECDMVYYAYFEPYSQARRQSFLGAIQQLDAVQVTQLGETVEKRALHLVEVNRPSVHEKKKVWVIGRQHPGEAMAEWFIEGLLTRLLQLGQWQGDQVAAQLMDTMHFYIVPNMNPDGSVLGYLRTNATGANLNREWMNPDQQRSPEVLSVREKMHQIGCDMFFDIHGDEDLPYVFVAGSEMLPKFTAQLAQDQHTFIELFKQVAPDFQDEYGYPIEKYKEDALSLASKYVTDRFGCLSLTLEMPFKDNKNAPNAQLGWNGQRSALLGAQMLSAIARYWSLKASA